MIYFILEKLAEKIMPDSAEDIAKENVDLCFEEYFRVIGNIERIGDHILNIAQSYTKIAAV